eukprot:2112014-Amphidinium_carterae.1
MGGSVSYCLLHPLTCLCLLKGVAGTLQKYKITVAVKYNDTNHERLLIPFLSSGNIRVVLDCLKYVMTGLVDRRTELSALINGIDGGTITDQLEKCMFGAVGQTNSIWVRSIARLN